MWYEPPINSIFVTQFRGTRLQVLKDDFRDVFYWVDLRPVNCPNLRLTLTHRLDSLDLVAIHVFLPMRWKKYLKEFCGAIETIIDMANTAMKSRCQANAHQLDGSIHNCPPSPG